MSLIINKKRLCVTLLSSIVIAVTLMVNPSTLIQVFSQEETPTLLTSEPTTTMPQPNLHLVTANNTDGTSPWPGPDRP